MLHTEYFEIPLETNRLCIYGKFENAKNTRNAHNVQNMHEISNIQSICYNSWWMKEISVEIPIFQLRW